MSTIQTFLKEMDQEAITTRKMLSVIPDDKFDWQPHPKSMTIRQLSTHIAELPSWVSMALTTDGLDFAATPYTPVKADHTADVLALFEKSLKEGRTALENAADKDLEPLWTLRNGEKIFTVRTKAEVIRMSYNQIVHHRAQLGVFLRLLDVPIPGSYGPSADDASFT